MKKVFAFTICVLTFLTGAAQYAPWDPSQGPLNFMTLDVPNHPYIRLTYNESGSYDNYEAITVNTNANNNTGDITHHKLITTNGSDPCRCYQVGNQYPHENFLPDSSLLGEAIDTVIRLGCNGSSNACLSNSQIEYWFYPQEDESTLLVVFTFAEEDVTHHNATENPRFYIEVLDGQTNQLIAGGYYPTEASNGTANEIPNTQWPYNRFLAVPSGNQSSLDHHTSPNDMGISTYYWAFTQATPTTFPFRKCPDAQNGSSTTYEVGWFEYKPIAFDLSSYAEQGKSVKLRIRSRACQYFAHWNYAMFYAKMIPGFIKVDACGAEPIHLSVPRGFLEQTYTWRYGYNAADALTRPPFEVDDPPTGITVLGSYDIFIDRDVLLAQPGGQLWPYYRCEMKSYTGVPFIYEAHIKSYFLEPDFNFQQLFNNCDLSVKLNDSSLIYTVTPPTQTGGTNDTTYQQTQLIQWFVKNRLTNNFDPIPYSDNSTNVTYTFNSTTIDTLTGEATIKIIIQDEEQKCIKDTMKTIFLDLSAIRDTLTNDTIYTCEEKLPYVYDEAYFGDTQTWSTEGTRRVRYESLSWNGCDSLVDVTLIVRKPKVEISFDLDYCDAFSTTLTADCNNNVAEYKWSTGENTPSITINAPGTYSVDIVNDEGCAASNSITIPACKPFLNLPNSITPSNVDGVNDYFQIPQRSLIKELEFTVFNRHGEIIYHTTNKDFEWNGTENGKLFVGATYNYILRIVDYEGVASNHKGSITIL